MDWQPVYDAFPANQELIWLNNCGTTPAGAHAVDAVTRFMEGYARKSVLTKAASFDKVNQRIKTILAGLLNCKPAELCLVHNTAEGMNFISHGVGLQPGDEIILLENEYPSNVYPWLHWKEKGVRMVTTPMETHPERFMQALAERITDQTRIVTLSAVHWCTGMPLPLADIGEFCRKRGVDFVVDGAQGAGMQPIDVKAFAIDYMAFSAWKWLMGPLGLGVFYISEEKLDALKPVFTGTNSVVRDEEYLPYRSELKPDADRFIVSTPNFIDWVYFQSTLEFLENLGFDAVRSRIFELSAQLANGLRNAGCGLTADQFPDHPTGIIVCEKPGIPAKALVKHLRKNGVIAAERLGRVRLSPHIYNSVAQMDQTAEYIGNYVHKDQG